MPPQSPHHVNTDEPGPLTDQDVEILHHIITTAQKLPDAERFPFRALFAAYDTSLAQYGINPDHDQVLFRFLLRMGGVLPDGTLYQKFEALLWEMDIRLEFAEDSEMEGHEEQTTADSFTRSQADSVPSKGRGRPRRASFTSTYDLTEAKAPVSGRKGRSRSIEVERARQNRSSADGRRYPLYSSTTEGQSHVRQAPLHSYRDRLRDQTSAEISSLGSSPKQQGNVEFDVKPKSSSLLDKVNSWHNMDPLRHSSPEAFQPQLTGLFGKVPSLKNSESRPLQNPIPHLSTHAVRKLTSRLIRKWRSAAFEAELDHRNMSAIAQARDRDVLIRQAFDQWRSISTTRRQIAETERFFGHMERRAERARDLFLITKAFTHWAEITSEAVLRTSVARRHILRTKYFNAWRDITAVNELKVRRHCLTKSFSLWRQRFCANVSLAAEASALHKTKLIRSNYWSWFWAFCERRAPEWWAGKTKRLLLYKWIERTKEIKEKEVWIDSLQRRHTLLKDLNILARSLKQKRNHEDAALAQYRLTTLRRTFQQWRMEARVAPLVRQNLDLSKYRAIRTTFLTWLRGARMHRQAQQADRFRCMRTAWGSWNEQLRFRVISTRINERVVLQSLYRWVLAERAILTRRLYERRLKSTTLAALVRNCHNTQITLTRRCEIGKANRDRNILRAIMERWKLQMQLKRQREQLAIEFHAPRVLQETLQIWDNRGKETHKFKQWAADAEFYFLTSKSLKRWRSATLQSKRQKRLQAYAHTRRLVKVRLASNVLMTWRQRLRYITSSMDQATKYNRDHNHSRTTNLVASWQHRVRYLAELKTQAQSLYNLHLFRLVIHAHRDGLALQKAQEEQAEYYALTRVQSLSITVLRRIGIRVFEIRRQQETASSLKDRNFKKHFRSLFKGWRERLHERQDHGQISFQASRGMESAELRNDTERNDDEWAALDEESDMGHWIPPLGTLSSSTPTPGYLSTPSKRAARARALVGLPSTPITTPIGFPFSRTLRSEVSTARFSNRKTPFGRSLLGIQRDVTASLESPALQSKSTKPKPEEGQS